MRVPVVGRSLVVAAFLFSMLYGRFLGPGCQLPVRVTGSPIGSKKCEDSPCRLEISARRLGQQSIGKAALLLPHSCQVCVF
jgi:hypothetical protein